MTDKQWQKTREIFEAARRQKPELRQKFLIETCGADKLLIGEVESLLASLDQAESFLETPAVAGIARGLENGQIFGHYEIVKLIGTGGMGEVYLARDKKLDRQVAVKILNPGFEKHEANLRRFIREAKTASALNHPNILVIHEIDQADGVHFIVSEYVNGRTLRDILLDKPVALDEIFDIVIQIAGALVAAHEANLIHRDIKPENIMIRPDRLVKVLDFGLAKLIERQNASLLGLDDEVTNQTGTGLILGTVNYMSPEQAKGEPVDERTDIFSLGVVIYEMIAGKTPFQGESVSETFANLINQEPAPLSNFVSQVPDELQRVINKALHKNTGTRYQSMQSLLANLKAVRENLSAEAKLERTSKGNQTTVSSLTTHGRERRITETISGFFQKLNNYKWLRALPILAALIVASLLFYQYQKSSASAHDLYLQGRFYAVRENHQDNDTAIYLLERAVALDPNHAPAYAELARAYGTRYFQFEPHQKQWNEKSHVALEKALAIKPDLAEAHEIRGFLLWMPANRFPHEQAIAAYRRSLALNPNLDEPHQQLGKIYLHIGLLDEALAEFRRALELNPGNTMARYRIGIVLQHQGNHEEALLRLKSTPPEINPAIVGRDKVWMLISLGRREEARQIVSEMLDKNPTDEGGQFAGFKALMAALDGNVGEAEREIQNAVIKGQGFGHFHHTAYIIACAYAALKKTEDAVRYLQIAADDGYPCYPLFEKDKNLDFIRQDPRFQDFLSAQKRLWEYHKTQAQY
jgi:serine/threonine protein kinase